MYFQQYSHDTCTNNNILNNDLFNINILNNSYNDNNNKGNNIDAQQQCTQQHTLKPPKVINVVTFSWNKSAALFQY